MFGANTGGGLFGGGANTGGGLFGGGAPAGGGLFGANTGGGAFGANTGGGLFGGGAAASGGGLLGGANTGGGLFGGANSGGGLFGGANTGGGLFGGQQASGGMFGQPAAADPNAMEQNFKQIGEQFAQAYYQTFASNKQGLAQFYEAQSCYTLDVQPPQPPTMVQGQQQILQHLSNLPIQHQPAGINAQPVPGSPDKVLLLVRGKIAVNGQQMNFVEVFLLMKKPAGNWFILNNTFQVVPP